MNSPAGLEGEQAPRKRVFLPLPFIRALGDVDSAALGHTHAEPPGSGAINTIVKLQNLSSVLGLETWRQFFSLRSMTEV